jgi:hypothetical protein
MGCPRGIHRTWPLGCECGVIPVVVGTLASLVPKLFGGQPSKSQQAYLDLAKAGSVHDATAIAEFASNPTLPDWAGWEGAWEQLIQQNPAVAIQGYSLARTKPQLNPSSGTFTSALGGVTQSSSGPAAGGGGGGITDALASFFGKVTAPSANTAAAAAGQAAAKQASSTIITVGLLIAGALVVGAIILRRR